MTREFQIAGWCALLTEVLIVVFIILQFRVTDMTLAKGRIDYFNTGWTMIRADGRQQGIESLPYAGESNAEEVIILENRIPQEYAGKTLSFLSAEIIRQDLVSVMGFQKPFSVICTGISPLSLLIHGRE